MVAAFGLTRDDVAVDLGCGTGQLTLPLAERVGSVIGVDPSPDMLAHGAALPNVRWLVGSDVDLPGLVGDARVGALTVGQALHWMDHEALFRAVAPMFRPGGGIAVVTNGEPLWLRDSDWSRALRGCLEEWFSVRLERTCGTDEASQRRYAAGLAAAGYVVRSAPVVYQADVDVDSVAGGVLSALSPDQLPVGSRRSEFFDRVRQVLAPFEPLREEVRVRLITGSRRSG
ncbi:MAG TPA: class I SAM-dependent methyltransferase [Pseudonocardiaceae bacterium]|nr:class I SAM-dependent methyltransferase [Pseudonocardiaceae bacterium]